MDISRLTLGEIAKVEELAGRGISALGDESAPKGNLLAALAYVTKKREDSSFTWIKALDLTMDDVTNILGLDEEDEDPKEQA